MRDTEGDDVPGLFFFFFNPAAVYRGRWWLSDIGSSRGADEEFSPSSLTQGYGSILLSTLFLLHHKTPSFCLSPLHLQSYRQLSLLSFLAACLAITAPFFLFLNFCLSFPLSPLCPSASSSFIFPPLVWSGTYKRPLSGLFCHALFSHFHTSVTLMKLRGRSCCKCWFHSRMPTRRISAPHLLFFPLETRVIGFFWGPLDGSTTRH